MLGNGDVFAGYLVERQLGRGGMGSVYLAKHPRLPRMTALKLLNREMFFDDEVRARFEREADLVARLDHPNIVTVYDRGVDDEQLWISMQFIDGVDASSVEPQSLPPARALQIIAATADALDYAHGMGVLHRDVKPANILLARSGAGRGERVYLTDFGIARLRDDTGNLTQTGTFTATLAYASPEQLTGAALDHRSDQYSLACTLFWLFTGAGPFAATNPAAVIQGHLQQPPPPLSSMRAGLPLALDAVLAKAMAKRPDDRFTSCSEFASAAIAALNATTNPSTPLAPRPTTGGAIPTVTPRPPTPGGGYPQAATPYPTSQPRPMTSPTPLANTGATPQPPHTGNQPYAGPQYQNRPPAAFAGRYPQPRRRKSNAAVIVLSIVGAIVLVVVLLMVIGIAASDGSSDTPTTTTAAPGHVTPDAAAISKRFPSMVPAEPTGDTGYNGATCYSSDSSYKTDPVAGEPDFGAWAWQWDCFGGGNVSDPFYRFYVYDSAAAVDKVVKSLPTNTKSVDPNGGKSYTNYKFVSGDGNKMVTVFTGDADRAQFLMFTDSYEDFDAIMTWWSSAPLNQ
ncbi:serine/threonine-protein kinase [Nocardia camponoti]|uniref:non-specific serine/threonine protein kinase n=1 Tax=Nocardia camponoti TaxID=1616106 RepID=A0A917QF17_9NOCA|nr:serine/threonine-protein kinase [Nocardia camponoti]GGK46795.1 hypothetical protein GCM10011591_17680 [Nocardia camponoti]